MKVLLIFTLLFVTHTLMFAQIKTKNESIGITISLPEYNSYRYYSYLDNSSQQQSGIFGIGGAIFFNKGNNKYSLNGAFTTAYNNEKSKDDVESIKLIELIVDHKIYGILHGIIGINQSVYQTKYNLIPKAIITADNTIGITTGAELKFTKSFSLAYNYRPSIYCFQYKNNRYMISLDARFDIRLWHKKTN